MNDKKLPLLKDNSSAKDNKIQTDVEKKLIEERKKIEEMKKNSKAQVRKAYLHKTEDMPFFGSAEKVV